jgi:chemotaxis signal transduction protein
MISSAPAIIPRPSFPPPTRRWSQSSDTFKAHLIFVVATELYGCPIEHVDRVLRAADATLRPSAAAAPRWEVGRLPTQRGDLSVISLGRYWGLSTTSRNTDREALLVVRLSDQSFVLLVDACLTVVSSLPAGTVSFHLPPQLLGPQATAFDNAVLFQKSLLVTLQLDRLFPTELTHLGLAETRNPATP